MSKSEETIMSGIEPEVRNKLISRREALLRAGKFGLGALSAPLAVSILAKDAFGQSSALPQQIVDVLNFAPRSKSSKRSSTHSAIAPKI